MTHDSALKGIDLRSVHQAINYDLVASSDRMYIRWSRLDWTDPNDIRVWTLLPLRMSPLEQLALARMPYLVGITDESN